MDKSILKTKVKLNHNKHHLFSKDQVETELINIFGYPQTEQEKAMLIELTERLHSMIPKVRIPIEKHKEIHGK